MIKSSVRMGEIGLTTGIGSLPQSEPEVGLDSALSVDIPYYSDLPQNGGGLMISSTERPPHWNLFLKRLSTDARPLAKTQTFGLFTLSRGVPGIDTAAKTTQEELLSLWGEAIQRSVLAMAGDIQGLGKQAIVFIDEPSWAIWDSRLPFHRCIKDKSDALLATLQSRGIRTGMHCCARGDFSVWLHSDLDYLSFDAALSLSDVLAMNDLPAWMERGGRLAFGIIPTLVPENYSIEFQVENFLAQWRAWASGRDAWLREALWTPACGLGTRSLEEAQAVFAALERFRQGLIRRCNSG